MGATIVINSGIDDKPTGLSLTPVGLSLSQGGQLKRCLEETPGGRTKKLLEAMTSPMMTMILA